MTWVYLIAALVSTTVVTWAANSAHKRRVGRQELRERRVSWRQKVGGPLQRLARRLRQRRKKRPLFIKMPISPKEASEQLRRELHADKEIVERLKDEWK